MGAKKALNRESGTEEDREVELLPASFSTQGGTVREAARVLIRLSGGHKLTGEGKNH